MPVPGRQWEPCGIDLVAAIYIGLYQVALEQLVKCFFTYLQLWLNCVECRIHEFRSLKVCLSLYNLAAVN